MGKTSQVAAGNKGIRRLLGQGRGGRGPSAADEGRCGAAATSPPNKGTIGRRKAPVEHKTRFPQPTPRPRTKASTRVPAPATRPTCHPTALNQPGRRPALQLTSSGPVQTLLPCADGETAG